MARTYLVTGGAGFIGRHLCQELLAYNNQIRVLDSLVEQVHGSAAANLPPDVELVRGDVRDPETVARVLPDVMVSSISRRKSVSAEYLRNRTLYRGK